MWENPEIDNVTQFNGLECLPRYVVRRHVVLFHVSAHILLWTNLPTSVDGLVPFTSQSDLVDLVYIMVPYPDPFGCLAHRSMVRLSMQGLICRLISSQKVESIWVYVFSDHFLKRIS